MKEYINISYVAAKKASQSWLASIYSAAISSCWDSYAYTSSYLDAKLNQKNAAQLNSHIDVLNAHRMRDATAFPIALSNREKKRLEWWEIASKNLYLKCLAYTGAISVSMIISTYLLYTSYKSYRLESLKLTAMQEKLMAVATYVRCLDRLKALISLLKPMLDKAFKTLLILEEVLDESDAEYVLLLKLLRSPTFSGNPSYFSNAGNIRAALTLFERYKDKLLRGLAVLAEADVLLVQNM